mmetsp:Transcript_96922/g.278412  ORF Transcript_96922/g.278412 Transcript_96922/m.278412 type:complete len:253 (+) Transcript_96922:1276-2034(+)
MHWSMMSYICCGVVVFMPKAGLMSLSIWTLRSSMIKHMPDMGQATVSMMPPMRKTHMAKHQEQHQLQAAHLGTILCGFFAGPSLRQKQPSVRPTQQVKKMAQTMPLFTKCFTVFGPSPERWPRTCMNLSVSVKKDKEFLISVLDSTMGAAASLSVFCKSFDAWGPSCVFTSVRAAESEEATPSSRTFTVASSGSVMTLQNSHLCLFATTSAGILVEIDSRRRTKMAVLRDMDSSMAFVDSIWFRRPVMKSAL